MAGQTITTSLGVAGRWLGFLNPLNPRVTCLQRVMSCGWIFFHNSDSQNMTCIEWFVDTAGPRPTNQMATWSPLWPGGNSKIYVANHNSELTTSTLFGKFEPWSRERNFIEISHPFSFTFSSLQVLLRGPNRRCWDVRSKGCARPTEDTDDRYHIGHLFGLRLRLQWEGQNVWIKQENLKMTEISQNEKIVGNFHSQKIPHILNSSSTAHPLLCLGCWE